MKLFHLPIESLHLCMLLWSQSLCLPPGQLLVIGQKVTFLVGKCLDGPVHERIIQAIWLLVRRRLFFWWLGWNSVTGHTQPSAHTQSIINLRKHLILESRGDRCEGVSVDGQHLLFKLRKLRLCHTPDSPLYPKLCEPGRVDLWQEKIGGAFADKERNEPLKHNEFTGPPDTIAVVLLRHNLHNSKNRRICKKPGWD